MDPALGIAPDGSPVSVFRALPAGPAVDLIHAALAPDGSVLDLGCGAGRLSRGLAALGHPVVGVDISPLMLAGLPGPTVCGDIADVHLGRAFDGVLLASYLINDPERAPSYLATCRRHVAAAGAVFIQRFDPLWAREAVDDQTTSGNVTVAIHHWAVVSDLFSAVVTYTIGDESWDQPISARILDDPAFADLLGPAGLHLDRWLDEHRTWAVCLPT